MDKLILFFALAFSFAYAESETNNMKITSTNVGPISKSTVAIKTQISKLFPKFTTKVTDTYSEGEITGQAIELYDKDTLLFSVTSDGPGSKNIFSIIISDPRLITSQGLHIGSDVSELLKKFPKLNCTSQIEEHSGEVACFGPSETNILYIFPLDEAERNGEDGNPVKITIARNRKIISIAWKPIR